MTEEDLAFETLHAVLSEISCDIDTQLLSNCYAVQKKHQFDKDRSLSAQMMDRFIDEYVDKLVAAEMDGAPQ